MRANKLPFEVFSLDYSATGGGGKCFCNRPIRFKNIVHNNALQCIWCAVLLCSVPKNALPSDVTSIQDLYVGQVC